MGEKTLALAWENGGEWGKLHIRFPVCLLLPEIPHLAKLALCTLPIPHTGVDVERPFSYYRMSRSALQRLTPEHHTGR